MPPASSATWRRPRAGATTAAPGSADRVSTHGCQSASQFAWRCLRCWPGWVGRRPRPPTRRWQRPVRWPGSCWVRCRSAAPPAWRTHVAATRGCDRCRRRREHPGLAGLAGYATRDPVRLRARRRPRPDGRGCHPRLPVQPASGRWRSRETVQLLLSTAYRVVAFHHGRQVGFCRAISDGAVHAYLADVYVLDEHQGKGLGVAMVQEMVEGGGLAERALDARHPRRPDALSPLRVRARQRTGDGATGWCSPACARSQRSLELLVQDDRALAGTEGAGTAGPNEHWVVRPVFTTTIPFLNLRVMM